MNTSSLRLLIGFLVSPGLPAFILYAIGLLLVNDWEAAFGPSILAMLAYIAAFFIGIPAYLVLRRNAVKGLTRYVATGALVGLAFYVLFFCVWALFSWHDYPEHMLAVLKNSVSSGAISVVYATVSSAVFWLIAVREAT